MKHFFTIFFLFTFFVHSCNYKNDGIEIESKNYISKIRLENINDTLNYLDVCSISKNGDTILNDWELPYPVFRFEKGDVNNDGYEDLLVGVEKITRFDSIYRKRIFIFKIFEGYVRPLWLGSRVSQPLCDFCFVKNENSNFVRTIEKEASGKYLVAHYRWHGFGLKFCEYLVREAELAEAEKIFSEVL